MDFETHLLQELYNYDFHFEAPFNIYISNQPASPIHPPPLNGDLKGHTQRVDLKAVQILRSERCQAVL